MASVNVDITYEIFKNIFFHDRVENSTLRIIYNNSDYYEISESEKEIKITLNGEPIKIIEIEIADYGILVPVGDSQQLFLAMKKMIENKSMYDTFCKTAYNRALQFDTDAILIQYENLLNQI